MIKAQSSKTTQARGYALGGSASGWRGYLAWENGRMGVGDQSSKTTQVRGYALGGSAPHLRGYLAWENGRMGDGAQSSKLKDEAG